MTNQISLKGANETGHTDSDANIAQRSGYLEFTGLFLDNFPYEENEADNKGNLDGSKPNEYIGRGVIECSTGWIRYPSNSKAFFEITDGPGVDIHRVLERKYLWINTTDGNFHPNPSVTDENIEVVFKSKSKPEWKAGFVRYQFIFETKNTL